MLVVRVYIYTRVYTCCLRVGNMYGKYKQHARSHQNATKSMLLLSTHVE